MDFKEGYGKGGKGKDPRIGAMTVTTHAVVGVALGRWISRPAVAFIAGLASHWLLDRLPHRDCWRWWAPVLEVVGVRTVLARARRLPEPTAALAGALGAMLPDVEHLQVIVNAHPKRMFPGHWFKHGARSPSEGIAVELLIIALALWLGRSARGRR
jgi:hypothetical protein